MFVSMQTIRRGTLEARSEARADRPKAGAIASSIGSESATPAPRRNARRLRAGRATCGMASVAPWVYLPA